MPGDDKTEPASPKKRSELRRRGQIPQSVDLSSMVVFVALVMALRNFGAPAVARLTTYMHDTLGRVHEASPSATILTQVGPEIALILLQVIGPIMAVGAAVGIAVNLAQTGFLVSFTSITPNFNSINPVVGFQQLFSGSGVAETLKSLLKLAIIGYIAYSVLTDSLPILLETIRMAPLAALNRVADVLYRLAMRIAVSLLVIGAADYAFQRWNFEKQNRMSKQEVKEEYKQSEGDAQIKGKIRAMQRKMAKRMMSEVPGADVLITNPRHFAVALKYDSTSMTAPTVVAKGADEMARKIREIARENNVPIVENPVLARALFRTVQVGREVPGDLYSAVAEVLAYVYQLNNRRVGAPATT